MALNTGAKDYGSNQSPSPIGAANMTEFNRLRHLISDNCQRIRRNNAQVQKMVSQLGGPLDNMELRDKLHKLQHQTNELAKETNKHLQFLATLCASPVDNKVVREQLTTEFSNVLKDFQALQRSQMTEEKKTLVANKKKANEGRLVSRHANLIDTGGDDHDDDELTNNQAIGGGGGGGGPAGNIRVQKEGVPMSQEDLEFLENNEGQIMQLEKDISDINQVFKDLSLLVHQQGEIVDSIEANTETASYNVGRGTRELFIAREYRDKIRRRKLCIVAIVTAVVAVLLLIIIISVSKSS